MSDTHGLTLFLIRVFVLTKKQKQSLSLGHKQGNYCPQTRLHLNSWPVVPSKRNENLKKATIQNLLSIFCNQIKEGIHWLFFILSLQFCSKFLSQ